MGAHVPFDAEKEPSELLTNFFTRFASPDPARFYFYRDRCKNLEVVSFREFFTNCYTPPYTSSSYAAAVADAISGEFVNRSDLFLSQTPPEFFAAIDQAVLDAGLILKEVQQAIREYLENQKKAEDSGRYQALNRKLHPVYVVLRMQGYNPKELCS